MVAHWHDAQPCEEATPKVSENVDNNTARWRRILATAHTSPTNFSSLSPVTVSLIYLGSCSSGVRLRGYHSSVTMEIASLWSQCSRSILVGCGCCRGQSCDWLGRVPPPRIRFQNTSWLAALCGDLSDASNSTQPTNSTVHTTCSTGLSVRTHSPAIDFVMLHATLNRDVMDARGMTTTVG